jgi:hypothetical protein
MMKSMMFLAFSQLCMAALSGKYCAEKGITGYKAYVQMDFEGPNMGFRVDGGMHWSACMFNTFDLKPDGLMEIAPAACMTRLAAEKTGGNLPSLIYSADLDEITMSTTTNFAILGTFELKFTKEHCEAMLDKGVTTNLPSHSEL